MRRYGLLLSCIGQEGAYTGQLASRGSRTKAAGPPVRQKCPKIRRLDPGQRSRIDGLAAIASEEVDEPMRRRRISPHRMSGAAAIMLKMGSPARGKRPRWMV
jgi:hypothetical protein